MEYWKDAMQAVTMFQKLWIEVIKDPELGPSVKKLDSLMVFDYSEDGAGAKLWVDLRGGKGDTGIGEPPDTPNLTLSTSADLGHKAWSNKLNAVVAITRKQVRVKGSATGLLKLAPKAKLTAAIYEKVLAANGMADKILK